MKKYTIHKKLFSPNGGKIIMESAIITENLTKYYDNIHAVNGINIRIPKGKIFGFLGPNGAGKSTTISMLSTLLQPTSGTANISGFDLKKDSKEIKHLIGLCPQELVIYDLLSARENIYIVAEMHGIPKSVYKPRADMLLKKLNLFDRANDLTKKFSGGMKRRLNIIMALIHDPDIVFLDEPTAGLDPQSRRAVWNFIRDIEKQNKTVILTTHNMDEADDLSDELAIIDHGEIIAQGTPSELKGKLGDGDVIEFQLNEKEIPEREEIINKLQKNDKILWAKSIGRHKITFAAYNGLRNFSAIYQDLLTYGISPLNISIRQNTLEDVFIELTGKELRG